eukprot:Gregarina_sp_Pseudo_9__5907@NODE_937_length_2050_cov_42_210343_g879_i0_p1_GENE_NODE_937_length_2050_cov_42_210343_g879_i0NODE_937_length_2050_cov_42_210343_g879_i0_p1_ORF_typecomplete_len597_score122_29D123/PF07065_14/2_1e08_NODE_937_length_2050_cov_42_210343_g879_i01981988
MGFEGGLLKEHVCATLVSQLQRNHPMLWKALQTELDTGSKAFTLDHLCTRLTIRRAERAPCGYTCSLLETRRISACRRGPSQTAVGDSASLSSGSEYRNSSAGPPGVAAIHKLPIRLQQFICALSKSFECEGTPSDYLCCLPFFTQSFILDDYSKMSLHLLPIPEDVLVFLSDDEDMKVNESFQFEQLMATHTGRNFYSQLQKIVAQYWLSGVAVEFNGKPLSTHSGKHITASDIVACLKSQFILTKAIAVPLGCPNLPSDYPLFVKSPQLAATFEDCCFTGADRKSIYNFYAKYMKGLLRWVPKHLAFDVPVAMMDALEAAYMDEILGDVSSCEEPQSELVDHGCKGRVPCDKESDTRSQISGESGFTPGEESDFDSKSTSSDEGRSIPPEVAAMSNLIDAGNHDVEAAFPGGEQGPRFVNLQAGCIKHGYWYPHHLSFRTPFPFEDSGFSLWRVFVYFGKPVAACPVNTSANFGDLESDQVRVEQLKRVIRKKVAELQTVARTQSSMSQNELPEVWRFVVDVWIKQEETWTHRIQPINKCGSLLFSWEELRQWGLFQGPASQVACPVVRVPETNNDADDFANLFAGHRQVSQRI